MMIVMEEGDFWSCRLRGETVTGCSVIGKYSNQKLAEIFPYPSTSPGHSELIYLYSLTEGTLMYSVIGILALKPLAGHRSDYGIAMPSASSDLDLQLPLQVILRQEALAKNLKSLPDALNFVGVITIERSGKWVKQKIHQMG